MNAYVIRIKGNEYSESVAKRCVDSAQKFGLTVDYFDAVTKDNVREIMQQEGLEWTWANMNTEETTCKKTGLKHFPYRTKSLEAKMACSMSHYLLWKKCVTIDSDMLILEHDAVFTRELPGIDFTGAIQINDPQGGGYKGKEHSKNMKDRNISGVFPLTRKRPLDSLVPDGFSGNSAYIVKPWAASDFIKAFKTFGVWPNDATICLQLFPWLEEYYPFITVVKQTISTSTS